MSAQGHKAPWPEVQLGDLLTRIEAGLNFKCEGRPPTDQEVGIVKVSAVTWGEYDEEETKTVTDGARVEPRLFVQRGDFLFSRANTVQLVGACVIARHVTKKIMLSDKILRFHFTEVDPAWVLYFLRSLRGRRQIEALASGNQESMRNIGQERIRSISLPLPTEREQRIVLAEVEKQLTRIDSGVAALKRVQANLKRYRASVLKAACEGRLVPTEAELARRESRDYEPASVLLQRILKERRRHWEESELAKLKAKGKAPNDERWRGRYKEAAPPDTAKLPPLPEGWCWATLLMLAELKGGLTKGQQRGPNDILRTVPYLRVANVQRGYLDLAEMKTIEATEDEIEQLKLAAGDVLFNEGGDRDKLGRGWIWRAELPLCIHQNHVFRSRLYSPDVLPEYVSWYGNSFGQKYFLDEGKQTTNLASINLSKLGMLPVPLPPVAEQARIFEEVQRRLSLMEACLSTIERRLIAAERLRQSILASAFSGTLTSPPVVSMTTASTNSLPGGRRTLLSDALADL